MTTDRDNLQSRTNDEAWNESIELTQGVPLKNNIDPSGAYPNINYSFGFSINHTATGAETEELWTGAGIRNVDLELPPVRPSVYPYNQVSETPYGHVITIDDTPGGERILIKHGVGSGIEIKPDGSVVITSRKHRVEVVEANSTVIVKGDANLVYEGNLNLSVNGDMNLDVGGDYNVRVAGQNDINILGSEYKRIGKNQSAEILENESTTILGNASNTVIGTRTDVVNEKFETICDNDVIIRSSTSISASAENTINLACKSMSSVSEQLGLIAHEGTIGGDAIEHFGKTYSGPSDGSGDETTFYGTLIGLAHEATTSRYAVYARESYINTGLSKYAITAEHVSNLPSGFSGGLISRGDLKFLPEYFMSMDYTQNDPDWRMPTKEMVNDILEQTNKGIKDTVVFDENITDRISYNDIYEGVFKVRPTLQEIRAAMRDKDFHNGNVPPILVSQGLLNSNYNSKIPDNMKRVSDGNATSKFGINKMGNPSETNTDRFKARK